MAKKMALPKIGVNMEEAVIAKWLISPGDTVAEGDPIIEAETDKSTQEIFATESGIVAELLAEEGETVPVHRDILVLIEAGEIYNPENAEKDMDETIAMEEVPLQLTQEGIAGEMKSVAPLRAAAPKTAASRVRISPLAKKMAKEGGLDIRSILPSIPGGRITAKDVRAAAQVAPTPYTSAPAAPFDGEVLERITMSGVRKTIAARLSQSNLEKPCAALTTTADAGAIISLREKYREKGIGMSFDAILAKIVAKALERHRNINTVLEGDEIIVKSDINIGVAVDAPAGLMVPVLKNANTKSMANLGEELKNLAEAAREGAAAPEDMRGGTFTITNLGMFGVEQFTPVINPPECCILAVGAIKKQFVPDENDEPKIRKTFQITLVFDHRIVDGAPAARFLKEIKEYIEIPELMM